jgi:ribosomal-protein-alanine N-acetyltransferase
MNAQNHKFPNQIYGEFIILQKITRNDAEFIFSLRKQKVAEYLNTPENYSIESQIKWQKSRTDNEINYIIYDGSFRVGTVSIYDCDWVNGVSNVGRLLLDGLYVHNSKPYGLEALKITYDYVFNVMDFRKITGVILEKNKKVFELQKFLGMEQEGYLKKHVILRGNYEDLYVMSLMKEDFEGYKNKINTILDKFRR